MKKPYKGPREAKEFRKEWDFTKIPTEELEGCFLYEYARESRTVLDLANELGKQSYIDGGDWSGPILYPLQQINPTLAELLTAFVPGIRLAETPWQSLQVKPTRIPGWKNKYSFNRPSRLDEMNWNHEPFKKHMEADGVEIIPIRINWNFPLHEIEEAALAWLRANPRGKVKPRKQGRHAHEEAYWKDALHRLGALRLWAAYPLKESMRIAREAGVKLYSDDLEGVRPVHQTAWENGVRGVLKVFKEKFRLPNDTPISWERREDRRKKNRKPK